MGRQGEQGQGEMKSSCWTLCTLRAWRTGQQAWNPGERLGLEGEHPDDRDIYREVLSLLTRPKTYLGGGQPWKAEICACHVPCYILTPRTLPITEYTR